MCARWRQPSPSAMTHTAEEQPRVAPLIQAQTPCDGVGTLHVQKPSAKSLWKCNSSSQQWPRLEKVTLHTYLKNSFYTFRSRPATLAQPAATRSPPHLPAPRCYPLLSVARRPSPETHIAAAAVRCHPPLSERRLLPSARERTARIFMSAVCSRNWFSATHWGKYARRLLL